MATKNLSRQSGRNVVFASDEAPKTTKRATKRVASKICRVCSIDKPLVEYRVKRSREDGRDSICALCARAWLANRKIVLALAKTKTTTKPVAKTTTKRASVAKTTKPVASKTTTTKRVATTKRSTGDEARAAADAKRVASVAKRVATTRATASA